MSVVNFRMGGSETEYEELEEKVFRLERDCWDEYVVEVKRIPDSPVEWVPTPDSYWLQFALLHEIGHAFLPWAPKFYGGGQGKSPSAGLSYEIVIREPTGVSKRLLFEGTTEACYQIIVDEANASSSLLLWDDFDAQRVLIDPVPRFRWADGFRVLLSSFEMLRSARESTGAGLVGYIDTGEPDEETKWTEEKNQRRCDLVDKEIDGILTPEEAVELDKLQKEMLAYRREVAPLPIKEARKVHRELLKKAAEKKE